MAQSIAYYDVVVASYWELNYSLPWYKDKVERIRSKHREKGALPQDDDPENVELYINELFDKGKGGFLHKVKWHRVS